MKKIVLCIAIACAIYSGRGINRAFTTSITIANVINSSDTSRSINLEQYFHLFQYLT